MGKRIKVTGYLNVDDMDPEDLDFSNSTGLSERGDMNVTTSFGENPYKIGDLEDIELELED